MIEMDHFLTIMKRLRKECPWDAAQTHVSLKRYLLEETYETLDAIDLNNMNELKSELGDLLLQVVFHSEIASENKDFSIADVINAISEKMVERHPHVFDKKSGKSADEVINNWEKNKTKSEKRESIFSSLPNHLPALLKAQKLQEKVSNYGFDWKKTEDVVEKLQEEIGEFKIAISQKDLNKIENEFGDVLFTLTNISRFIDINAEESLHKTNKKFQKRFEFIEKQFNNNYEDLSAASLETLNKLWEKSKDFD